MCLKQPHDNTPDRKGAAPSSIKGGTHQFVCLASGRRQSSVTAENPQWQGRQAVWKAWWRQVISANYPPREGRKTPCRWLTRLWINCSTQKVVICSDERKTRTAARRWSGGILCNQRGGIDTSSHMHVQHKHLTGYTRQQGNNQHFNITLFALLTYK